MILNPRVLNPTTSTLTEMARLNNCEIFHGIRSANSYAHFYP